MTILEILIFLTIQLFFVGFVGVLSTQNNVIFALLAIEIMLLAANVVFVISSVFFGDVFGQIFALFVLAVAAAESAVGLFLVILYYNLKGSVSFLFLNTIKS